MSEWSIPEPLPSTGFQVPLRVSFTGMKKMPHIALCYNQIFPLLVLYPDGVEFRVFIKRKKDYSQIERIDALETFATHNVIIVWKDSAFAFVGNVRDANLFRDVLRFFQRKQLPLSDSARQVLDAPRR